MKKPKKAQPIEPVSFCALAIFPFDMGAGNATPQLGQTTALGSTCFPQLGQYLILSPHYSADKSNDEADTKAPPSRNSATVGPLWIFVLKYEIKNPTNDWQEEA